MEAIGKALAGLLRIEGFDGTPIDLNFSNI